MLRICTALLALAATLLSPSAGAEKASPRKLAEEWVLQFVTEVAPPGRKVYYSDGQETKEEAEQRYESIARDVVSVVYHRDTKPVFHGSRGRTQTASVVLGVMLHESGFMKHIDYGIGKYARGDKGKSWCLLQTQPHESTGRTMSWNIRYNRMVRWGDSEEDIILGFTGEELVQDRTNCITAGLRVMRSSFASCRSSPVDERLALYASGSCSKGKEASRKRIGTALRWFQRSQSIWSKFTDDDVVRDVSARSALPEESEG